MAEIKRLFRPFSQANVSIASRFGGAGLGLSSVKQLARTMGGDIEVAPRRGGGTTFTLTVRLEPAARRRRRARAHGNGRAPVPIPPLRILGVEDNPFGRVVLNTILSELGHQAEFIGRGEAAVERIEQGAFDAVLMDMVLPGIDGVEAIRRIRDARSAARAHRHHRRVRPRRRRGGVARRRRRRLPAQACVSAGASDCAA